MSIDLFFDGAKRFCKNWGINMAVVITAFGLLYQLSEKIIVKISAVTTEVHSNTLAVQQLQRDFSDYKVQAQERRDRRDIHEVKQDGEIEVLKIDVARLKVKANIANIDCLMPYFYLGDLGINPRSEYYYTLAINP